MYHSQVYQTLTISNVAIPNLTCLLQWMLLLLGWTGNHQTIMLAMLTTIVFQKTIRISFSYWRRRSQRTRYLCNRIISGRDTCKWQVHNKYCREAERTKNEWPIKEMSIHQHMSGEYLNEAMNIFHLETANETRISNLSQWVNMGKGGFRLVINSSSRLKCSTNTSSNRPSLTHTTTSDIND